MTIQHTPNYSLPFPSTDRVDAADVPKDISALAGATDNALVAVRADELIGEIKIWPIAAPPNRFLNCDGALYSRSEYPNLFNAIGTTFNQPGDPGTGFRVPDGRGRTIMGVDGSAGRLSANDTLGKSGGKETAALSVSNLPVHNHPDNIGVAAAGAHGHSVNDPGHVHTTDAQGNHGHTLTIDSNSAVPASNPLVSSPDGWESWPLQIGVTNVRNAPASPGGPVTANLGIHYHTGTADVNGEHSHNVNGAATGISVNGVGDHTHTKTGSVQGAGGNVEHENLPPYMVANYIIRYA